ncbi:MAG: N-acetyl-gamma-glutamyl-phosphate reductase [Gammaproteobacteria bacterium]|nr:N-acetyl-gamma-glutamyl-phosphate reductase [Gammaproteobacteria bacterium]
MISVGVVGGTGYTGAELLRLLVSHPQVKLQKITSRASAGKQVADEYPHLRQLIDMTFCEPDSTELGQCDVVFFATPNCTAMQMAPQLLNAGARVIDLAADFRLQNIEQWQQFYDCEHTCPEFLPEAVYGLPEINREKIRDARLIANPGCYPTAVSLGFLPLLKAGIVVPGSLIADAKSGISGAGRQTKPANLFSEVAENFRAYAVGTHRHRPEIEQTLRYISGVVEKLVFVPHVVPMVRGIHATLYAQLTDTEVDLQRLYVDTFADELFVDVLPPGSHPETASVRGSNTCRIAVHKSDDGSTAIILVVEDNLVKGAAGQAIQNMNIMFGLDETLGLMQAALWP